METTEEYFDRYLDKYNELKEIGELWRIRVTPQEFLAEIERVREYGIEARKAKKLTEYHIQKNVNGMITNMLMNKVTREEFIEQAKKFKELSKIQFAAQAPSIQEGLKKIKAPLKFDDIINIYRWLFRKQITLEMLSPEILDEFKQTRQYEDYLNRDNRNKPQSMESI